MRVHFYIEANPIRAGLCKFENLQTYKYSSYKFYAFGFEDEFTSVLTIPEWYLKLGKTAKERQRKYRALFREYLKNSNEGISASPISESNFIGTISWILETKKTVKKNARK